MMIRVAFAAALILGHGVSAEKKLDRAARPARKLLTELDHAHVGSGVQFKVKKALAGAKGLRGETEHARVSRAVGAASKAVKHLTGGGEAVRVFRHAGEGG